MPTMTEKPQWLRVDVRGKTGTVDREKGIIHGVILTEEGPFKDKRGEFDRAAIRKVVSLAKDKPSGLKSRFTHPNLSDDGLGKFLGRYHDVRSDTVLRETGVDASGKPVMQERSVARGDLYLDKTSLDEPPGGGKPLGVYVMDLAESDSDALGASLVVRHNEDFRLDKQGRRLKDEAGEELPPLWIPTALHACDVVDDGDATHSFLSADILAGLPDAIVRQGCDLLDAQFDGQTREVVQARLTAFMDRYLNRRYGEPEEPAEQTTADDATTEAIVTPAVDEGLLLDLYLLEQE